MTDDESLNPILRIVNGNSSAVTNRLNEITIGTAKVHIIEMEDVLFHFDSAVMMPGMPAGKGSSQQGVGDNPDDSLVQVSQNAVSGIDALAIVFKQFEFDPVRKIVAAAHADTSGDYIYNFELCKKRGENVVALLLGESDKWADLCAAHHQIEDYQQVLTFVAGLRNWTECDPLQIDNKWGPNTEKATKEFLLRTVPEFALSEFDKIRHDSKKRWTAMAWRQAYDTYEQVLAQRLGFPQEIQSKELATRRSVIASRFVRNDIRSVSCGELWPIDSAQKNNYKSQLNRRVELLLFDENDGVDSAALDQCVVKEGFRPIGSRAQHDPVKYKKLCPIWPFRNFFEPVYIDPSDLQSFVFHLRFVYGRRGKTCSVPDGLKIQAFECNDNVTTEIPTEQIYRDGIYYVKVKFTRKLSDPPPDTFYFSYSAQDTWVFVPKDPPGQDATLVAMTRNQIDSLVPEERAKYHNIPDLWNDAQYLTYYTYPGDYSGQLSDGDTFQNVCRNVLHLRPFGFAVTSPAQPLTFSLDPLLDDMPAIMLYPAFGTPAIVTDDGVLTLLLLANFTSSSPRSAVVNAHLRAVPWEGNNIGQIKRDLLTSSEILPEQFFTPLFSTQKDAIANIRVEQANMTSDGIVECDRIFLTLYKPVIDRYDSQLRPIKVFITLPQSFQEGFYNLFWINRSGDYEDHCLQEALQPKPSEESDRNLVGPGIIRDMTGGKPIVCGFKLDPEQPILTEPDTSMPVCSFHPFFYKKKHFFNVGHVADLHIASRTSILKRSPAKVIEAEEFESIGNMVHDPYVTVSDLFDKMGTDPKVDIVFVAGDLIDYIKSFYPTEPNKQAYPSLYRTPQGIWEAIGVADRDEANAKYQDSVDFLTFYSLLLRFYQKYHKPVFVISGNHDPYYWPWGVSPRVTFMNIKANAGIPADANLTFYEIILAYGNKYDVVVETSNFIASKFEIFFSLFTPILDFAMLLPRFNLIGLSWGMREDIIDAQIILRDIPIIGPLWGLGGGGDTQGIGHLPRSEDAVSDRQLKIINYAVNRSGTKNLLCSHFTFASYLEQIPFLDQHNQPVQGRIEFDTGWNSSEFDMGSFETNRKILYETYFLPTPKLHYVLTGHSHRRGLYQITRVDYSGKNHINLVPRDYDQVNQFNGTKIIVPDSAGNLPRINTQGEFMGWSSARSSFTRMVLNDVGDIESLDAIETTNPKAWPRIAVAFDYLFIVQSIDVIDSFESEQMSEGDLFSKPNLQFTLRWIEPMRALNIDALSLYAYFDGRFNRVQASCNKQSDGSILCNFDFKNSAFAERFKRVAASTTRRTFISIQFHPVHGVGWNHFRYDSPYTYEVMLDHRWVLWNNYFAICRPRDSTEDLESFIGDPDTYDDIPDWQWRQSLYQQMYPS